MTYIPAILKGMKITIANIFRPKFTIQYPEEKFIPPDSFRGRPILVVENGIERCVACGLCSRVCPALAIEVQANETEHIKSDTQKSSKSICFAVFSAVFVKFAPKKQS